MHSNNILFPSSTNKQINTSLEYLFKIPLDKIHLFFPDANLHDSFAAFRFVIKQLIHDLKNNNHFLTTDFIKNLHWIYSNKSNNNGIKAGYVRSASYDLFEQIYTILKEYRITKKGIEELIEFTNTKYNYQDQDYAPRITQIQEKDSKSLNIAQIMRNNNYSAAEMASIICERIKNGFFYTFYSVYGEIVPIWFTDITNSYNNSIKKVNSDDEKLEIIIKHVQQYFRLRPFCNNNSAMFTHMVLNYLLMQNSFPPALPSSGSVNIANFVDGYSVSELKDIITKNMQNTLELINNNNNNKLVATSDYAEKKFSSIWKQDYTSLISASLTCFAFLQSTSLPPELLFKILIYYLEPITAYLNISRNETLIERMFLRIQNIRAKRDAISEQVITGIDNYLKLRSNEFGSIFFQYDKGNNRAFNYRLLLKKAQSEFAVQVIIYGILILDKKAKRLIKCVFASINNKGYLSPILYQVRIQKYLRNNCKNWPKFLLWIKNLNDTLETKQLEKKDISSIIRPLQDLQMPQEYFDYPTLCMNVKLLKNDKPFGIFINNHSTIADVKDAIYKEISTINRKNIDINHGCFVVGDKLISKYDNNNVNDTENIYDYINFSNLYKNREEDLALFAAEDFAIISEDEYYAKNLQIYKQYMQEYEKYICPITFNIIKDPIKITLKNGIVKFYEKEEICSYVEQHNQDPSTFEPLTKSDLKACPEIADEIAVLKDKIATWKKTNKLREEDQYIDLAMSEKDEDASYKSLLGFKNY